MAFTLTPDISQQKNTGEEPIDLGQSKYDFDYLVFPNDLGKEDNGHYMIININIPIKNTSVKPAGQFQDTPGFGTMLPELSKVDRLRYPGNLNPGWLAGVGGNSAGDRAAFSIPRRTRRITKSIAMHMPTPLVFNTHNAYEEISLSALAGKLGTTAIAGLFGAASSYLQSANRIGQIAAGLRKIATPAGQVVSTASKLLQSPINPAVEILFANTLVRQFTIELLMAPRNEKESLSMHTIIKTLRFHGAPEINTSLVNGLFWIPPAEFDITFFNKGVENMNILRINTCVLERIEVDYAPSGVYATFRNGHPVSARLSMGFRELEPIHKKRILQGF